jgi:DNA-binding CsgD family transcriptional regulator
LKRGWDLAEPSDDGVGLAWLGVVESGALLKLAKFGGAAAVASRCIRAARRAGVEAWFHVAVLTANGSAALLAAGRTAEAAAIIDPLTLGAPERDHYPVHLLRAEIDLLRGDLNAAGERQPILALIDSGEFRIDAARLAAELALWAGRPGDALAHVELAIPELVASDLQAVCGRLLSTGMRACADLAEQARARRDAAAADAAAAAASTLVAWVDGTAGMPFADHPLLAAIAAERASWDAELSRLAGAREPELWSAAARAWQNLGCPHRAGYAWWRQAQALLAAGQPSAVAASALQAAAAAANGHVPLLSGICDLAGRVRIHVPSSSVASRQSQPPHQPSAQYGLTIRELAVLELLAQGRTNAEIGAELYISPSTAGVHVSNILRKLGVPGRVQAAILAERAGILGRTSHS